MHLIGAAQNPKLAATCFVVVPAIGAFTARRVACACTHCLVAPRAGAYTSDSCPIGWPVAPVLWASFLYACWCVPIKSWLNRYHKRQPVEGAVFVTGAEPFCTKRFNWLFSHLTKDGMEEELGRIQWDVWPDASRVPFRCMLG